jgi:hypothetical protein
MRRPRPGGGLGGSCLGMFHSMAVFYLLSVLLGLPETGR